MTDLPAALAAMCEACFQDWHESCHHHEWLGTCCCGEEDLAEDDDDEF